MDKPLIVVCGPTSTGKTSLAIRLCQKFKGEIVSADSRQIYKGMDIGTGKIPANNSNLKTKEIKRGEGFWIIDSVYVHLYDVVAPDRDFSVARYKDAALQEIESLRRRNKVPFLVGGTGFYIAGVLGEMSFPQVPPNLELRRELEKIPVEELFEKLQKLDAERAKTVDPKNPRRLIRAIEIASSPEQPDNKGESSFAITNILKIGLTSSNETLFSRADVWVDTVLENGLVEEVQSLVKCGYKDTPSLRGIIYATVVDHLEGKISADEMRERIKFDLHGYIRRQITWFKRDKDIVWFDIAKPNFDEDVQKLVESYLDYGSLD